MLFAQLRTKIISPFIICYTHLHEYLLKITYLMYVYYPCCTIIIIISQWQYIAGFKYNDNLTRTPRVNDFEYTYLGWRENSGFLLNVAWKNVYTDKRVN